MTIDKNWLHGTSAGNYRRARKAATSNTVARAGRSSFSGILCVQLATDQHSRRRPSRGRTGLQGCSRDQNGAYYSTKTAAGQVTFGYLADGSYKSINFNLSGIKLPDGTVLKVTCYMPRPSPVAYCGVATTQSLCSIVAHNGVGTLDLSTTSGNVPDSLLPGGGSTQLYITPANGSFNLTCSFGAAVRKGGRP